MKDMAWRGCLVHRHGEVVDIDRPVRGLRHGRFLLVRELMEKGFVFAVKNAMCTEDIYSYTGTKVFCWDSTCVWGSLKEVSPDSGRDSQQRVFSSW